MRSRRRLRAAIVEFVGVRGKVDQPVLAVADAVVRVTADDGREGTLREEWQLVAVDRRPEITLAPAHPRIELECVQEVAFEVEARDLDGDPQGGESREERTIVVRSIDVAAPPRRGTAGGCAPGGDRCGRSGFPEGGGAPSEGLPVSERSREAPATGVSRERCPRRTACLPGRLRGAEPRRAEEGLGHESRTTGSDEEPLRTQGAHLAPRR